MTNWHHGKGNSGPRRQIWRLGDRVQHVGERAAGTIAAAGREPKASETAHVWVVWDDGQAGYCNPDNLDVAVSRK